MPDLQNSSCGVLPPIVQDFVKGVTVSNEEMNEIHRLFHELKQVQNYSGNFSWHSTSTRHRASMKNTILNYLYYGETVILSRDFRMDDLPTTMESLGKAMPNLGGIAPDWFYQAVGDVVNRVHSVFKQIKDPLVFPSAAGRPMPGVTATKLNAITLDDSAKKSLFLEFLHNSSRERFDRVTRNELIAKQLDYLADKDIFLASSPQNKRRKRIAISQSRAVHSSAYMEYIAQHCSIRTKTIAGNPVADSILVASEYLRNPFRGLLETIGNLHTPGYQLTELETTLSEVVNVGYDVIIGIVTAGAYPIVKYGTAKALSITGQTINNDSICLKREFSADELANLIFNTEIGISDRFAFHRMALPKPQVLKNAKPFEPSGVFVQENVASGIHTEKYIRIIVNGEVVMVREKTPGEYVTYHPLASHPELLERPVYFDQVNQRIYYSDDLPNSQGFDFDVIDGKKFITMDGIKYQLHYNWRTHYPEIQVDAESGTKKLPVYMEILGRRWHLEAQNAHSYFRNKHIKIIDRIKVSHNAEYDYRPVVNRNPNSYGNGLIYEVRSPSGPRNLPPRLTVIELHGALVPVRESTVKIRGIQYEVYGSATSKKSFPIEWDGRRWLFESATSRHVSIPLKNAIRHSMFDKKVSAKELSAPDEKGIRWDQNKNGFIKIKNGFVPIRKYKHSGEFYIRHEQEKLNLQFKNNQFFPETLDQTLHKLWTQGVSGRGIGRASKRRFRGRADVDIIKDMYGMNADQAKQFLSRYAFPKTGAYDEINFTLYIESYGRLPHWAERYKIDSLQYKKFNKACVQAGACTSQATRLAFRERKAVNIIKKSYKFSLDESKALLNRYRFEPNDMYDVLDLAQYIEGNGRLPHWAERYKIDSLLKKTSNQVCVQTGGCFGRFSRKAIRRRLAVNLINQSYNLSPDESNALLNRYRFEPGGLYDELDFAQYFKQNGAIPAWAERAGSHQLLNNPVAKAPVASSHDLAVAGPSTAAQKALHAIDEEKIVLGNIISSGVEGNVYLDKQNDFYVIKKFKTDGFDVFEHQLIASGSSGSGTFLSLERRMTMANRQALLFQRYYGEEAATVVNDGVDVYMKMYKVPGIPLNHVQQGALPDDAVERFVDMLVRLNDVGIWHGDLNSGNILYDAQDNLFYPIDFSNVRDRFYAGTEDEKRILNLYGDHFWNGIIHRIQSIQHPNAYKKRRWHQPPEAPSKPIDAADKTKLPA